MFSFQSKKIFLADILDGYYDIHCHLLPGVDDGCANREHCMRLLERLQGLGAKGMYMTPHIISGAYDDHDENDMRRVFGQMEYTGPLDIRLAAEYFVDDKFVSHIEGQPLTMGPENKHLLAEFSMNNYSIRSFDLLFEATVAGYDVILAHPERYTFVNSNPKSKTINLIKQHRLQLNLLSLSGFHGTNAKRCAEYFLDQDMYTYMGTDIHSNTYIDVMQRTKVSNKVFNALKVLRENNATLFVRP